MTRHARLPEPIKVRYLCGHESDRRWYMVGVDRHEVQKREGKTLCDKCRKVRRLLLAARRSWR